MEYFFKEIVSNPARLSDGREAPFEPVGGDNGILATDDQEVARMLDELIKARRGGVYRIDKDAYDEALKKKPDGPLPQRPRLSDPPRPPVLSAVPDSRHLAGNVVAATKHEPPMALKAPKPRSDAPTIKLPGFGAPPQAPEPEAPKVAAKEPPSGDATVNRPVPKKVAPSHQPPPKPPE